TVILAQLAEIRNAVAQLNEVMNTRFTKIDMAISTLTNTVNEQFQLIDFKVGALTRDVAGIRSQLITAAVDMDRLQKYLLAWITDLSRAEFLRTVSGDIGYAPRTGRPLPTEEYARAENVFWDQGVNQSLNQTFSGPNQCGSTIAQLYN